MLSVTPVLSLQVLMCAVRKVLAEPEHGDVSQLSLRTRTRTLLHFSERHREPAGSIPAAETHT